MKHNKTIKSIFALILCAFITISGIGAQTAFAAGKKISLKVGFKGTTITLIRNLCDTDAQNNSPAIKTIIKKWGKAQSTDANEVFTTYTWKKGKTSIEISDYVEGGVGSIVLDIKDKNGSLYGIKVGMKKAVALKKAQKMGGKKNVVAVKEGQEVKSKNGGYVAVGTPTGKGEQILVFSGEYLPIEINLKNGKVSSIYWFRS